jgi:hypothetical protein
MIYRSANSSDSKQIALLHADSWRRIYQCLFSQDFLDKEADSNRVAVWKERLNNRCADRRLCCRRKGANKRIRLRGSLY